MKVISRNEARKLGLKRYFTGKPCKHDHVSERYVTNACCMGCISSWRIINCEHISKYKKTHGKSYNETNKSKIKEKRRLKRMANVEAYKARHKEYCSNNPDKIRLRAKKWKCRNPQKIKVLKKNYEHRKRGADGAFTKADVDFIFGKQGGRCLTCDVVFSVGVPYTIDHNVPVSRGGTNWPNNLGLLCGLCNSKKGAKTLDEFLSSTCVLRRSVV